MLLAEFGVPVPKGAVAYAADKAAYVARNSAASHWAVKAQIHAGARGKAGGVRLCRSHQEVAEAAAALLGKPLVTAQTGPAGQVVHRLYIEKAEAFTREIYLGLVLDRKIERIRIVASAAGGMEVEEIAAQQPDIAAPDPGRTGGGAAAFPGARARLRIGPQSQTGRASRHRHHGLLSGVP